MRIEHSLEIEAPAEVVWGVTIDVERWPEWTPTIQRVERPWMPAHFSRSVAPPGSSSHKWPRPYRPVQSMTLGQRFSWATERVGLRMVGTHEIIPKAKGCTSRLGLEVSGLLGRLLWPLIRARPAADRHGKQRTSRSLPAADT